jgi:hypothetical protein
LSGITEKCWVSEIIHKLDLYGQLSICSSSLQGRFVARISRILKAIRQDKSFNWLLPEEFHIPLVGLGLSIFNFHIELMVQV